MYRLASPGKLKRICLPLQLYELASWLWRKCPNRSSNSKRTSDCLPYRLVSQLSQVPYRVRAKAENHGCMSCAALWFYLHDHWEGMRKRDDAPTWASRLEVGELQGKAVAKKRTCKKVTPPDAGEDLRTLPLLILMKGLLVCSYRNQVMNALTSNRGALPPAKQRKGTTSFTGLYGTHCLAHQTHGSITLWQTLVHSVA